MNEKQIREDERLRVATLIESGAELFVDFTGGSTLATLELVVYLLRLDPNANEPTP